MSNIKPILWQCLKCGYPTKTTHLNFCQHCITKDLEVNGIISLFEYQSISKILTRLKHQGSYKAKKILKELLTKQIKEKLAIIPNIPLPTNSIIVPVPNHPLRVLERGLDHTMEIAKIISDLSGYKTVTGIVKRTKYTKQQAKLQKDERTKNVANSFVCKSNIPFENVILVDDVATTLSTLNEVAKAIKKSNKHVKIYAIVIGRATIDV